MADDLKIGESSGQVASAVMQAQIKRLQDSSEQMQNSKSEAEAKKVAGQFESMIVSQMFKAMWQTVPDSQMFGHSNEQQIYKDMLNQAIADSLQEGPGLGVREVVYKDIKRMQGASSKAYSNDHGGNNEGK
jgi:flagellar protein FlgJ